MTFKMAVMNTDALLDINLWTVTQLSVPLFIVAVF